MPFIIDSFGKRSGIPQFFISIKLWFIFKEIFNSETEITNLCTFKRWAPICLRENKARVYIAVLFSQLSNIVNIFNKYAIYDNRDRIDTGISGTANHNIGCIECTAMVPPQSEECGKMFKLFIFWQFTDLMRLGEFGQ